MMRYSNCAIVLLITIVALIFLLPIVQYIDIISRLSIQQQTADNDSIITNNIETVHPAHRGQHANFQQIEPYQHVDIYELVVPQNAPHKCSKSTDMIIIVIARDSEYTNRSLVRNTWAKLLPIAHVSLVFLIGVDKNYSQQNIDEYLQIKLHLRNEIEANDDLVVVNIFENYHNLTLKTYAALQYARRHCPMVKCVVKTDVDSIINIPAMFKICKQTKSSIIRGDCFNNSAPSRNLASKHFIPFFVYEDRKFPTYCYGSCYMLIGRDTTRRMIAAVEHTKFYNSTNYRLLPEDLMFTGIVANAARINRISTLGITHQRTAKFHCFDDLQLATPISMQMNENRSWIDVIQKRPC